MTELESATIIRQDRDMIDGPRLDLVDAAIRSPIYGNIQWKDSAEQRALKDPQMKGLNPQFIRSLLRQFVLDGNSLDVRVERREEYKEEDEYWYRARIPVAGFPRPLFVEVLLIDDDPKDPFVEIVNAHF